MTKGVRVRQETICVQSGTYHDAATRGVNTPIFTSSSFEYLGQDEVVYPRYFNTPNQEAVVAKICSLEGAEDGVLFSSGMAALSSTVLAFAGAGDHVVMLDELYGGTRAFATDLCDRLGIKFSFAATDAHAVAQAITPATKMIVIESPTNPLMGIIDIAHVARIGKERGIVTVIDNTFATPVNQRPLRLGIDIVVHSGTKYMGGHSDLCCGVAIASSEHATTIRHAAKQLGGSVNAVTCSLLERSLKTLAIRVERQTENASGIAAFLASHDAISRVNYPGLSQFSGHQIAQTQMTGFGAMLSFELDGRRVTPASFLPRLTLVRPAVSLGGVETLICSPAETSHASLSEEERRRVGITDALLRLSVGIEHVDDLVADLSQALDVT
jgi:cystathionine beta-lyase/cystathionine gamma-synthase